jgi:glycogen operon protein
MYVSGKVRARDDRGEPIRIRSLLVLLHAGAEDIAFRMPGPPYGPLFEPILDSSQPDGRPAASAGPVRSGQEYRVAGKSVQLLAVVDGEAGDGGDAPA